MPISRRSILTGSASGVGLVVTGAAPSLAQTAPTAQSNATLAPPTDYQIEMAVNYRPREDTGAPLKLYGEQGNGIIERAKQDNGPVWGAPTMTGAERDAREHKARIDQADSDWEKRRRRTGH